MWAKKGRIRDVTRYRRQAPREPVDGRFTVEIPTSMFRLLNQTRVEGQTFAARVTECLSVRGAD
jgi:hypothetical protein